LHEASLTNAEKKEEKKKRGGCTPEVEFGAASRCRGRVQGCGPARVLDGLVLEEGRTWVV